MNPSRELDRLSYKEKNEINERTLQTYLSLCEIEGVTKRWLATVRRYLLHYLDHIKWNITQENTIEYLKLLLNKESISHYRKQLYQIRKFLAYLNIDWSNNIKPPSEPEYIPKRVAMSVIRGTLSYLEGHRYFKQFKAIILLGSSSGMRAEELYQLKPEDIDLKNRIVHINHNPPNCQRTKTKKSRVTFFNKETQRVLEEYLPQFYNDGYLKQLFSKTHIQRAFRNAPLKVKDLRKAFSQEWDRQGGPTSIKKILMGHSLRNDIDLMHYNFQSEEDLKKIYDKIMSDVFLSFQEIEGN